jgi:hypothetical protein
VVFVQSGTAKFALRKTSLSEGEENEKFKFCEEADREYFDLAYFQAQLLQ